MMQHVLLYMKKHSKLVLALQVFLAIVAVMLYCKSKTLDETTYILEFTSFVLLTIMLSLVGIQEILNKSHTVVIIYSFLVALFCFGIAIYQLILLLSLYF
ncbi:hypothetical protein [Longirhabdus pacifica]|uniref:hypothetical protein n=1 Tax=Longirhabdus pacifica TaxID=2305227 RepID=UPI0010093256|nr:hypothetical protein [Longirhabdus pacifica]